ncbi:ankyrin repeat domain-containing protein 28 [Thecamonas trahens ATCC 50062]|uniref:Ankyrin repeat domain-containing protein 28 n=1 Tax=Thecamonas trahens ATCC 50062 TaxID=461836 RepID=A0A0L0DFM7_THETB|nr:ankyrin repeat domain-containing protein 28 [Thecamonas trahens ATCC 50062]KNC51094.1 ankyrin repeat domain-containing protein 28 [Thecamonas trahens ATCC 50062]|eukprot:XP_013756547.1 ankyrin repeat domain-containing protein 28 [Thecamonas trahens ATCC 50062]
MTATDDWHRSAGSGSLVIDARDAEGFTPLHLAAGRGELGLVCQLLAGGASPCMANSAGVTPLHLAITSGVRAVVKVLLEAGASASRPGGPRDWRAPHYAAAFGFSAILADLLKAGRDNATPLQLAAASGDMGSVHVLLAAGARLDMPDVLGNTPLHYAAMYGHREVIVELVSGLSYEPARKALINALNSASESALHLAAGFGYVHCVVALLEHGASIRSDNAVYGTPVHYAATGGHLSVLKVLLHALPEAANLTAPWQHSASALHLAARANARRSVLALIDAGASVEPLTEHALSPLHDAAAANATDVVSALLDAGAAVDAWAPSGSPLFYALPRNALESLDALITGGADVNHVADAGAHTPLHVAAYYGAEPAGAALLKAGAAVEKATGYHGLRAFHIAVLVKNVGFMRMLVREGGADVHARTRDGHTALHFVLHYHDADLDMLEALVSVGFELSAQSPSSLTVLHEVSSFDAAPSHWVHNLVAAGAHLEARDIDGATPLHHAVVTNSLSMVKALLKEGAAVNSLTMLHHTPLHLAAHAGADACIVLLHEMAPKHTCDAHGLLPAHHAARGGYTNVLQTLLLLGVDVLAAGSALHASGRTTLHHAVAVGQIETVRWLLDAGADPHELDSQNQSPLHLAALAGDVDLTKLLVAAGGDTYQQSIKGTTPISLALQGGHFDVLKILDESSCQLANELVALRNVRGNKSINNLKVAESTANVSSISERRRKLMGSSRRVQTTAPARSLPRNKPKLFEDTIETVVAVESETDIHPNPPPVLPDRLRRSGLHSQAVLPLPSDRLRETRSPAPQPMPAARARASRTPTLTMPSHQSIRLRQRSRLSLSSDEESPEVTELKRQVTAKVAESMKAVLARQRSRTRSTSMSLAMVPKSFSSTVKRYQLASQASSSLARPTPAARLQPTSPLALAASPDSETPAAADSAKVVSPENGRKRALSIQATSLLSTLGRARVEAFRHRDSDLFRSESRSSTGSVMEHIADADAAAQSLLAGLRDELGDPVLIEDLIEPAYPLNREGMALLDAIVFTPRNATPFEYAQEMLRNDLVLGVPLDAPILHSVSTAAVNTSAARRVRERRLILDLHQQRQRDEPEIVPDTAHARVRAAYDDTAHVVAPKSHELESHVESTSHFHHVYHTMSSKAAADPDATPERLERRKRLKSQRKAQRKKRIAQEKQAELEILLDKSAEGASLSVELTSAWEGSAPRSGVRPSGPKRRHNVARGRSRGRGRGRRRHARRHTVSKAAMVTRRLTSMGTRAQDSKVVTTRADVRARLRPVAPSALDTPERAEQRRIVARKMMASGHKPAWVGVGSSVEHL